MGREALGEGATGRCRAKERGLLPLGGPIQIYTRSESGLYSTPHTRIDLQIPGVICTLYPRAYRGVDGECLCLGGLGRGREVGT